MTKSANELNIEKGLKKLAHQLTRPQKVETNKNVYIISGPPGSGKTTYIKAKKSDKDLVVDLDYICAALNGSDRLYKDHEAVLSIALELQKSLFKTIKDRQGKWENAFIATALPDKKRVEDIAREVDGKIIHISTPLDKCIEQIKNDSRREGKQEKFIALTEKWFEINTPI